jgi:hypothetical protein
MQAIQTLASLSFFPVPHASSPPAGVREERSCHADATENLNIHDQLPKDSPRKFWLKS